MDNTLTLKSETTTTTTTTTTTKTMTEEENIKLEKKIINWFKNWTWKSYLKLLLFLTILACGIAAAVKNQQSIDAAKSFLHWMDRNIALGTFIFIAIYFLATVLFIPGSILTIGGAFVFSQAAGQIAGVFIATIAVFIGAATGATAAFLLGRFLFRDNVVQLVKKYEKFEIIDEVVKINGLKVTFLLRLTPVIPFNALNYAMSLTSVSFRDYCIAHIGMIPGTIAYCFLGSTISSVSDSANTSFSQNKTVLIFFIVGSIVAFVGMLYVAYIAKRQFSELTQQIQTNSYDHHTHYRPINQAEDLPSSTTSSLQHQRSSTQDNSTDFQSP